MAINCWQGMLGKGDVSTKVIWDSFNFGLLGGFYSHLHSDETPLITQCPWSPDAVINKDSVKSLLWYNLSFFTLDDK